MLPSRFSKLAPLVIALLTLPLGRAADSGTAAGSVSGMVVEPAANRALEYVAVTLHTQADRKVVRQAATDAKGKFVFESVPFGEYQVSYNAVGGDARAAGPFTVDAAHRALDLGRLPLADGTVKMEQVAVSARKEAFYNSIDRKVYNVGKDLQSVAGSASDLLQNVPSVQVDIEGNVS
ncbi:MAG: carboxypeptidase-like regulatory domain-containing protein, partial [Opitutaceae bacterium]